MYEISELGLLPLFVLQMLSELEKQVLIKEIWDGEVGWRLLAEGRGLGN